MCQLRVLYSFKQRRHISYRRLIMFSTYFLDTLGVCWLHNKKQVIKRKKKEFAGGPFYWTKNKRQIFENRRVFLSS